MIAEDFPPMSLPQIWLAHRNELLQDKNMEVLEQLALYRVLQSLRDQQRYNLQSLYLPQYEIDKFLQDVENRLIDQHVQQWNVCTTTSQMTVEPHKPDWLDIDPMYKDIVKVAQRFFELVEQQEKTSSHPTSRSTRIEQRHQDKTWRRAWEEHFQETSKILTARAKAHQITVYTHATSTKPQTIMWSMSSSAQQRVSPEEALRQTLLNKRRKMR